VILDSVMLMRAICMLVCIREGHGKRLSARSVLLLGFDIWLPYEENILDSQGIDKL